LDGMINRDPKMYAWQKKDYVSIEVDWDIKNSYYLIFT